jgi:hypothetical protein
MAETILLCGFYCAATGSLLLIYSIMRGLIRQTFSNSYNAKDLYHQNKSDVILISDGGVRGYDSPEVFEEDLMLRLDQYRKNVVSDSRKQLPH